MKLTKILPLLLIAFAAGCASDPMVGRWAADIPAKEKAALDKVAGGHSYGGAFEFQGAGKFTFEATGGLAGQAAVGTVSGTYKLSGRDLTLTITRQGELDLKDQPPQSAVLADDGKSFIMSGQIPIKFVKQ